MQGALALSVPYKSATSEANENFDPHLSCRICRPKHYAFNNTVHADASTSVGNRHDGHCCCTCHPVFGNNTRGLLSGISHEKSWLAQPSVRSSSSAERMCKRKLRTRRYLELIVDPEQLVINALRRRLPQGNGDWREPQCGLPLFSRVMPP